jgi:1,4-alpha-glucan branching enzyme
VLVIQELVEVKTFVLSGQMYYYDDYCADQLDLDGAANKVNILDSFTSLEEAEENKSEHITRNQLRMSSSTRWNQSVYIHGWEGAKRFHLI